MKKLFLRYFGFMLTILIVCSASIVNAKDKTTLIVGWESWEPYQYIDSSKKLTGLDIDLFKAIASQANYTFKFKSLPWKRHLKNIEIGKVDIALGASKTPEREKYAYFSDPYRTESAVLFVKKGNSNKYNFKTINDLTKTSFRLGVELGYYYGEDYAKLIKNPDFKKNIQEVKGGIVNLKKLLKGRIDGFLADPVVGVATLKREGKIDNVEIHPMKVYSDDIYIMLSKKSISTDMLDKIDQALKKIKEQGIYEKIMNKYLK